MEHRFPENSKFTIVALRGANVEPQAVEENISLEDGLLILGHSPVTVDEPWPKWLGTIQIRQLIESNLVVVASTRSTRASVLDDENEALERRCRNVLIALALRGLWLDGPGLILNGYRLDDQSTEATQVRQVRDTAWYRRLHHTIPPTLTREALVAAVRLAEPVENLRQRTGTRLHKGLAAVHKGLEGRYGDERLHQFVRSLEAIIRPDVGRTERQFVHRTQLFIGRSNQSKTIARQMFRLRSCVEHMNDYRMELKDIADSKEAAEKLAQRRSLQVGLLATHVYRHILGTPELFALFAEETRMQEFWAKPDHEQDQIWKADPIDLEMLANNILGPLGLHRHRY